MKTTIDRAIDTLSRLPDLDLQLIQELMLLRSHGVMENSCGCPAAGCSYVTTIPLYVGSVDDPPVCPRHGCPLVILTVKQTTARLAETMRRQAAEFAAKVEEVAEQFGRIDDTMFLAANERDELNFLRGLMDGPAGRFAMRMVRKQQWEEWEPEWKDIVSETIGTLEKMSEAIRKGNRLAVSELTADVGNYMLKTAEIYGD